MEKQKQSNAPVLLQVVIRIFGFIYGLMHLMFLISFVILTVDSSVGPDAISVALMTLGLLGTLAGYWMLRARYSTLLRKLLIGLSMSLFLILTIGMALVAPQLV